MPGIATLRQSCVYHGDVHPSKFSKIRAGWEVVRQVTSTVLVQEMGCRSPPECRTINAWRRDEIEDTHDRDTRLSLFYVIPQQFLAS
jgi:hypothetical protein